MAIPDFEKMTLEEIDEWNVAKKAEIRALQAEYDLSNEPRIRKVIEANLAEARKQITAAAEKEGISPDEMARRWLEDTGRADPGHNIQGALYLGIPVEELHLDR
jgi:hypothetical protein